MMDTDGPMTLDQIPPLVTDIVNGLNHAHSMNIIMCDLCPTKISLDSHGNLKLADFSLAREYPLKGRVWSVSELIKCMKECFASFSDKVQKSHDQCEESRDQPEQPHRLTSHDAHDKSHDSHFGSHDQSCRIASELAQQARWISFSTLPSPFYLSPESINDNSFSPQSDLWSIGCIMYELWTGFCPFVAENPKDLINVITTVNPHGLYEREGENLIITGAYPISPGEGENEKLVNCDVTGATSLGIGVLSVIRGLLCKESSERMTRNDLEPLVNSWIT